MSAGAQISWDETPQKPPDIKWDEPKAPEEPKDTAGFGRSLAEGTGGDFNTSLSDVGSGLKHIVTHPLDSLSLLGNAASDAQEKEFEKGFKGSPAHFAYGALPVVGPQLGRAATQFEQGNIPGGLGSTAAVAAPIVILSPEMRGSVGAGVRAAVEPVRSLTGGTAKFANKVASAPLIRHAPGMGTVRAMAGDVIDLTKKPAPKIATPPDEPAPAAPQAASVEAPSVQAPRVSDIPAPVRLGPGQVPADIIGATNDRVLPAGQGIRTTPRALLPASTEAPPVRGTRPNLAPPHIELPPRFTPRYDLMEDKAFQDSANADLERHGRRAFKEERDQFEAGNKVDVPKGELTKKFREEVLPETLAPGWSRPVPVRSAPLRMVGSSAGASADTNYFQAARQALGAKASVSDAAQLAQKLKESGIAPGASLEELLRKSIELAKSKKK